jgi:hypothetical protein
MSGLYCSLAAVVVFCVVGPAVAADPQLSHMVYFKLKDNSDAARDKLVAACKEFLSEHEGTIHFSVGVLAKDFNRPVNDKDFDVTLNLVFRNKAAHDKYQDSERHKKFIEKCQDNWDKVRVFDSYLSETK